MLSTVCFSLDILTTKSNAYSVSQNPPPWNFLTFFPKWLGIFVQIVHAYHTFLSTLDYKLIFNYLQLWQSYAILSVTTIMCSKCPPSTEKFFGWSHLICRPVESHSGARENIIAGPYHPPHSVCLEIETPKASRGTKRGERCPLTIRLGVRGASQAPPAGSENGFYAYFRSERSHLEHHF